MHHGSHVAARRIRAGSSTGFDRFMLVIGIAVALMTLPQAVSVFRHGPDGVSLISWSAYTLHSALWTAYGAVHREPAVFWANGLWGLMNALVVIAILTAS